MSAAPKLTPTQPSPQPGGTPKKPHLTLLKAHGEVGLQNFPPAGNGKRFLAALIDSVVVNVAMGLVSPLIYSLTNKLIMSQIAAVILGVMFYYIVPTTMYGYTLGKKMLGLKVVTNDFKSDLGFGQMIMREVVGKFVLALGCVWVLFNRDHKAWHDMISNTRVIEFKN